MKKITSEKIIFKPAFTANGKHCSDILYNGKVIGALIERERSFLAPIETIYQMCVAKSLIDANISFYDSEDEGFVFATFKKIEDFIEFYNNKCLI